MPLDQRLLLLTGLVILASIVGIWMISRSGLARKVTNGEQVELSSLRTIKNGKPVAKFGEKLTLLQFSSEFCSSCQQTSVLLESIEKAHTGVLHIDVDITDKLDLAKTFNILTTPTILILNSKGGVVSRIVGAPKLATMESELDRLVNK
jgi:thiol-disulfide isomerase/thioredoxin